jgi:hypothetical protein
MCVRVKTEPDGVAPPYYFIIRCLETTNLSCQYIYKCVKVYEASYRMGYITRDETIDPPPSPPTHTHTHHTHTAHPLKLMLNLQHELREKLILCSF